MQLLVILAWNVGNLKRHAVHNGSTRFLSSTMQILRCCSWLYFCLHCFCHSSIKRTLAEVLAYLVQLCGFTVRDGRSIQVLIILMSPYMVAIHVIHAGNHLAIAHSVICHGTYNQIQTPRSVSRDSKHVYSCYKSYSRPRWRTLFTSARKTTWTVFKLKSGVKL